MILNFLTPQPANFPVNENTLFQQDGATSHTARISMNAVNALFPGRVISRNGDIPWPPRSPDLTACDFFFYGDTSNQKCLRPIHQELSKHSNNAFGTRLNPFP